MLIILLLLLFLILLKKNQNVCLAYTKTLLFSSLYIYLSTEFLSFFNQISVVPFYCVDTIAVLSLSVYLFKNKDFDYISYLKLFFKRTIFSYKYLALLLVIILPLLCLTLFVAPNNWDSMTYHLPRIEHWIQNANVDFYPTDNLRQLYHQPLAEYFILHFRLTMIGDYFSSSVQFLFYLGLVAQIILITKLFTANPKVIFLSIVSVACMPILLLEASTTQNDIVAAFFFLSIIYFVIEITDSFSKKFIMYIFLSLSLGFLTKATVLVFIAPFLIIFSIQLIRKFKLKIIFPGLIGLFFMLTIVSPYLNRNIQISGHLMGDKKIENQMKNTSISIKNTTVNVIRNVAMNLALPSEGYNNKIDQLVQKSQLIIAKEVDSPQNTFGQKFQSSFRINEDLSGQFLLFVTFIIASVLLIIYRKKYSVTLLLLLIGTCLSFILFSSIFKWQPFGVRLFVPLYCLMALFPPLILEKLVSDKIVTLCSYMFLISSIPYIYFNQNKPLIPLNSNTYQDHNNQYFLFTKKIKFCDINDFTTITSEIKSRKLKNVGLALNNDTWEYPLWIFKSEDVKYYYSRFEPYLKNTKNYSKNKRVGGIITDEYTSIKGTDIILDSVKTKYLKFYILKKEMDVESLFIKSNEFTISYDK